MPGHDGGDLAGREGRPDSRVVQDSRARCQRRLAQHSAVTELAVEGCQVGLVRWRQRLEGDA